MTRVKASNFIPCSLLSVLMERPQDGGLGGDPRSIAERVRALRLAPAAFLAATLKFSLGFLVQSKKRKKGKNLKLIHVVVAVR